MINLGDILARQRRNRPEQEAVVDLASGRRLSFRQLDDAVNRTANALAGIEIRPGDHVAVLSRNSIEFLQAFYALAKLGAVVVPMNWRLVGPELEYLASDAGISAIIYESMFSETVNGFAANVSTLRHRIRIGDSGGDDAIDFAELTSKAPSAAPAYGAGDDDLLYIMYTSGTTGRPKGSMHTHRSAFWAILTMSASCDYRMGDRQLIAMPLFHVGALIPAISGIYRSTTLVLEREFSPERCLHIIASEAITTTLLVPAMLLAVRQVYDPTQHDLASMRWLLSGASPVPADLIRQYQDMGVLVVQGYGLTESGGPAAILMAEDALDHVGSTGRAMFHTDVRVVDVNGSDCAPGQPGELRVRGDHLMTGYWNQPEATEKAFENGWLLTGDIAIADEEGFITIVDRAKDVIISGAENIYPAEIENVLTAMPGVIEAAVIGVKSERWVESPLAVVVRDGERITDEDVIVYCRDRLARYKKPGAVRFVERLPRNASGKVLKAELRARFADIVLP